VPGQCPGQRGVLEFPHGPVVKPLVPQGLDGLPAHPGRLHQALAAVQARDEQSPYFAVFWPCRGQRLEFPGHLAVFPEADVGLQLRDDRGPVRVFQPGDLRAGERPPGGIRQRRATPLLERPLELPGGFPEPPPPEFPASAGDLALESDGVDLLPADPQTVGRRARSLPVG
jgi:hypothetical protein